MKKEKKHDLIVDIGIPVILMIMFLSIIFYMTFTEGSKSDRLGKKYFSEDTKYDFVLQTESGVVNLSNATISYGEDIVFVEYSDGTIEIAKNIVIFPADSRSKIISITGTQHIKRTSNPTFLFENQLFQEFH